MGVSVYVYTQVKKKRRGSEIIDTKSLAMVNSKEGKSYYTFQIFHSGHVTKLSVGKSLRTKKAGIYIAHSERFPLKMIIIFNTGDYL